MKSFLLIIAMALPLMASSQLKRTPNVVLIITDDQGFGDLGINGNPHIKTPVLDKFAQESVRFNNFYVSPVCAPTRASLMTGRYSLRTGVRDTYNGGAIMSATEITIAELLKGANYKTGIFGKWHLGDNYPSRPKDQGFDESVIHLSGGMGQVGDFTTWFKGDRSYFDPVLWHNGVQQSYNGYCSDIFAEQAINFIEQNKKAPFFCYLSFNAPHTPLQVPEQYYDMYKNIDPAAGFETDNRPFSPMSEKNKEDARRVYAMVSNVDHNIGKLLQKLEDLKLVEDTLVIFMTDNGPQQVRYVAGMKGRKGTVYRGGVRVPFYMRYPQKFKGNSTLNAPAAHLDVLPTIAEICNLKPPEDRIIDGRSLVPLINGAKTSLEERPLFFYWTRKYPEKYYGMALQKGDYKLVAYTDSDAAIEDFELFNIASDPYEQNNKILEHKQLAGELKFELDSLYGQLMQSKNLINPPQIVIGKPQENPITLNRNDAGGDRGIWDQEDVFGKWHVKITAGDYNIRFKFIKPVKGGGRMLMETGAGVHQIRLKDEITDIIEMKGVSLPALDTDLIPFYLVDGQRKFPFWVELELIN
ncbi:arylsulfatase [Muriicola sp. Z0-33]|uniref:arylsulfatase n=1 Tax=Muriicola sp. Z0-33 TaxID=2816957 RepID=UPI002237AE8B|nr:arylsulfatase [Muriicola sp. Z0-33]MCW5516382.1 arylsulfatase [Muriicola sp. Z0-33]